MGRKTSFFNGITDLLVLSILYHEDSYPYDMCKYIREKTDGFINISQNTLYTVIYKLVKDEMISEKRVFADNKRARVYYHIEQKGLEYHQELLSTYDLMCHHVASLLNNLGCREEENE